MAGGKETPRQKMIGMMYLVLTALLALNVSKEILDAFIAIDKGVTRTNTTIDGKASNSLLALEAEMEKDPAKTKPFLDKAQDIMKTADALDTYIEEFKAHVMSASMTGKKDGSTYADFMVDGRAIPLDMKLDGKFIIRKPDENQNNTALLVGPKPDAPRQDPWSAYELRNKLEGFREELKNIQLTNATGESWSLTAGLKATLDSTFSYKSQMEDEKEVFWETKNFYHVPLAAIITYLSTIETTVKKAKADVLEELQKGINAKDLKFTDVTVAVVPKQSYVLRGDSFVTEVYLAAFDKTRQTKVYIGGEYTGQPGVATPFTPGSEVYTSGPDGKVRIKKMTGGMSLGDHGFRGMIEYQDADGSNKQIPFNIPPFTIAEPALVVSPAKMNVFYRGLPNPVEISVPGADLNKIEASCAGHQLVKDGPGKFTITPGAGATADISVVAEINGAKKQMGVKQFRVKRMPDPVPNFNGKYPTDNVITKTQAKNAQGILAEMKDFDFEAKATIKSYTLVVVSPDGKINEQNSNGNKQGDGQKAAIEKLKPGQSFSLENILCKMPDGTDRKLSNITLRIING